MKKGAAYDVITIGSAVIDHYAKSGAFELRKDAHAPAGFDTCFPLGAKLVMDEIVMQTGGGATNAAVTFSHLGLKTASVCRVGDDPYGKMITQELASRGISTEFVQTDRRIGTGQSIILLADSGERSILVFRGASAVLKRNDIPWRDLRARWFYVTSLGGDIGLLALILDRAEACSASVFWNPGGSELKKGMNRLAPLIRRADVLDLNREEAAELADVPPRHLKRIVGKIGDLPKMALLISDGPRGAYLHTKCCTWHAPPLPVRRVNATGAGDAFGSGFTAGFMRTCDLSEGLKVGMLNAAGVISAMGAKAGILASWPKENVLNRVHVKPARLKN
jgi:ribokinase